VPTPRSPALLELRDWMACQGVTLAVMDSGGDGATSAHWKPPSYLPEDDITCQVG
jgi:hypothetical protein